MLKDDFVATVSHELRTPLTSIAGSLGLLEHANENLSEPSARLIKIAIANSERLVRLINGILDIEKIESGKATFDMHRTRIHPIVGQCIEAVRGMAAARSVRIVLDGECTDCEVHADPDRLAQVVTNLLSNAIKYSPSGKEVAVSVRRSTNAIRVSVRDHGPGIPAAFKPMYLKNSPRPKILTRARKAAPALGSASPKRSSRSTAAKSALATPPAAAPPSILIFRNGPRRPNPAARQPTPAPKRTPHDASYFARRRRARYSRSR
jgi:hypothetical protein